MELKEKITLDMLTKDSVSVLRQQFLTYNRKKGNATAIFNFPFQLSIKKSR